MKLWKAEPRARLLRGEALDLGAQARKVGGKRQTLAELTQYVCDTD